MKYDYSEIGDMFKASKGLYSWQFTLDDKLHKIELISLQYLFTLGNKISPKKY